MLRRIDKGEPRTAEELLEDYRIEKELADRLRHAPAAERARLYTSLYDEMYRRTPRHPQLRKQASLVETSQSIARQMGFLRPFLKPDTVFLEVGPGDCALAFEVARRVELVYAVDVSTVITATPRTPPNFRLLLSDGTTVPVPPGSVDVAYSYQLMEHLHPDDAAAQLAEIARALAPGGIYLCATPSRVSGPHDISKYFDDVATGFHLREYTFTELRALLRDAGFASAQPYLGAGRIHFYYPAWLLVLGEKLIGGLPPRWRRRIAPWFPVRVFLGLRVVARKPATASEAATARAGSALSPSPNTPPAPRPSAAASPARR